MVVTGTRLPLTSAGLAQSVTVIDQREIRASRPARVEDLLARVAGVYVDQAGTTGGFASMYMRGAENSHMLVLLDGVRLNDPTTTRGSAYDLSAIDISQVERIEVLRGPASAVYGGEALAGVVHFITRRAQTAGPGGTGYAAVGGGDDRRLGALLNFGNPAVQAQLNAGHSESGGPDDAATLRLDTVAGSLGVTAASGVDGEIFASQVERRSEAFPDDSGGPRLAVNRALTTRDSTDSNYGVKLGIGDAGSLRLQVSAAEFHRRESDDNAAIAPGQRFPVPAFLSDTDFRRRNLAVTVAQQRGDRASIVAGVETMTEDGSLASVGDFFFSGSAQSLDFNLQRRTNAIFAESRLQLAPSLAVQIGLRHDHVEDIDSVTTPHLGVVWDLPGGATTLKANFNEGFKAPSFFALGFPIGGNPGLKPERSRNAELALARRIDGAGSVLGFSVFRTRYEDLVDFDSETFTNINRGTIVVQGIEPEVTVRIGRRWLAQANASLLDIDVRDGLQPLRNRPERLAGASIAYEFDAGQSVFVGLNHNGGYLDRSNPTGDIGMPGVTVADAAISMPYRSLRVTFAIDNLLDESYEQFVGFPAQGRRLRVELRGDF